MSWRARLARLEAKMSPAVVVEETGDGDAVVETLVESCIVALPAAGDPNPALRLTLEERLERLRGEERRPPVCVPAGGQPSEGAGEFEREVARVMERFRGRQRDAPDWLAQRSIIELYALTLLEIEAAEAGVSPGGDGDALA
jgi:hypothetical protein